MRRNTSARCWKKGIKLINEKERTCILALKSDGCLCDIDKTAEGIFPIENVKLLLMTNMMAYAHVNGNSDRSYESNFELYRILLMRGTTYALPQIPLLCQGLRIPFSRSRVVDSAAKVLRVSYLLARLSKRNLQALSFKKPLWPRHLRHRSPSSTVALTKTVDLHSCKSFRCMIHLDQHLYIQFFGGLGNSGVKSRT